ncbi:PREDICTED: reverse mRNAase, partial [Prunus dulcis]
RASGQQVNFQKSAVCFCKNVHRGDQLMLAQFMGIPCVDHHSQYLGLPMVLDKKKGASFNHLKERLWKKLQTWKGKLLSGAGKEILIKVVAQAIPIYTMSYFLLPKYVCEDLNKLVAQFWWNSSTGNKKIHWMAWDRLCAPKEEGGLGFRNLHAFNLALLAKQGWRLLQNPNSLITKVLKAKYFPTRSFLETVVSPHASVVWKSLCEARTVIIQGSRWQVGSGDTIGIWEDRWLPQPNSFRIFSPKPEHSAITKVSDLIHGDSREWNAPLLQNVFFPEEVMLIRSIPLSLRLTPDMLVWHYDKKGMFTVKSAYHVARSLHSSTGRASSSNSDAVARNWSLLWKAFVPARVKIFWWRVISGILPTKANLARKKVSLDEECMLCAGPVESSIHILRDCPFAICA